MEDIQKEHIQEEVTKILQRNGSGIVKISFETKQNGDVLVNIATTVKGRK